jgi:hypothetical protein
MPSRSDLKVSVVVIGYAPAPLLSRCLRELREQQKARDDTEVVVVAHSSHQGTSFASVRTEFPEVHWIEAPVEHNVARLRGLGIARSGASVIALLEGDCLPAAGWLERLAQVDPVGAVGGAIEPGNFRSGVDWAAYLCEFAPFMNPLPPVPTQLPGTNVVYRREALPDPARLEREGLYETFLNATLGARGLATDSALIVRHERTWRAGSAFATRFHHGRVFAALRVRDVKFWKRTPYLALAIALPFVLVARVFGEVLRRRRYVGRAILAAPWIVALSVGWAVGELAGYAAGAGTSLDKWR